MCIHIYMYMYIHIYSYIYIYTYMYFKPPAYAPSPSFILVQRIGMPHGPHATEMAIRRGPWKPSWGAGASLFEKWMRFGVSEGSYGRPWGAFGVHGGSGRIWGGWGGVPGRFQGILEGPLESFLFFRGEFVNCPTKYWCFQFAVVLWGGRLFLDYVTF